MSAEPDPRLDAGLVLARALLRGARELGLAQKCLARMLGISEASTTRLTRGRLIAPDSKEGELAVLFLRVYRSLSAVLGGGETNMRSWMHAHNHHLGGTPAELIQTVAGLVRVADYLDAMRGQV